MEGREGGRRWKRDLSVTLPFGEGVFQWSAQFLHLVVTEKEFRRARDSVSLKITEKNCERYAAGTHRDTDTEHTQRERERERERERDAYTQI